jgi:hypothetical protein
VGMNKHQIIDLLNIPNHISDLKKKVDHYNNHIWDLHSKKLKMEKELEGKRKRLFEKFI